MTEDLKQEKQERKKKSGIIETLQGIRIAQGEFLVHLILAIYSSVLRTSYIRTNSLFTLAVVVHWFSFCVPFFSIGRKLSKKFKDNTMFINTVLETSTVVLYQGYIFYVQSQFFDHTNKCSTNNVRNTDCSYYLIEMIAFYSQLSVAFIFINYKLIFKLKDLNFVSLYSVNTQQTLDVTFFRLYGYHPFFQICISITLATVYFGQRCDRETIFVDQLICHLAG